MGRAGRLEQGVPGAADSEGDPGELSRRQQSRVEELEARIIAIRQEVEQTGAFLLGVRRLTALAPELGRPRAQALIRIRALLRHHTAWSLVHSGYTASAVATARLAVEDARQCFAQTEDPAYLDLIIQTAMIASHAELLRRQPEAAEGCLALAGRICAARRRRPPADFHRQAGVAAFQRGDDQVARLLFERAGQALADQEPSRSELDVRFIEKRHTLCSPSVDWDGALELRADLEHAKGDTSLSHSMMTHYTVAAAFLTDSPRLHITAAEFLEANRPTAARFGHQATRNLLLRATPALRLALPLRREWLRFVMHQNAYQRN